MRCRYCKAETNLMTEPWEDPEDGFISDEVSRQYSNTVKDGSWLP